MIDAILPIVRRVGGVIVAPALLASCSTAPSDFDAAAPRAESGSLPESSLSVEFRVSCTRCVIRHTTGELHRLERVEGSWSFERSISPAQRVRRPEVSLTAQPRSEEDVIHRASILLADTVGAEAGPTQPGEPVALRARVGT